MYYKILLVFLLLITPFVTNAKDISVLSGEVESKNFDFELTPGIWKQKSIIIKNDGEKNLEVDISTKEDDILNLIFITQKIPERYKEELKNKNNDIKNLCDEYSSDIDLSKWCTGETHPKITLKPKSQKTIQLLMRLPKNSKNTLEKDLNILAGEIVSKNNEELYNEKTSVKLHIKPVLEREVNLKINNLFLQKNLSTFDFLKWAKQGFKETYNINVTVLNTSKNQEKAKIPFETKLITHVVKSEKEFEFSKKDEIKQNTTKEVNFENVEVPWFGAVIVTTEIIYKDKGVEKNYKTKPVRIFIFPIREVIGLFVFLIITSFFGFFWKKRRMLIGKEKKHEKITNEEKSETKSEYKDQEIKINNNNMKKKYNNADLLKTNPDLLHNEEIDVEWLKDEEKYEDSSKKQAKKINRNILVIGSIIIFLILSVLFVVSSNKEPKKLNLRDTSIDDLIEKKKYNGEDDITDNHKADGENENNESNSKKEIVKSIKNSEISIQILNGGAETGMAGQTTNKLKQEGYKTNDATNAKQNIEDLVVYYPKDNKNKAKQVLKSVLKFFDDYNGKLEESNEIPKQYGADTVIVLGKKQQKISKNTNSNSIEKVGGVQILDGGSASHNIEEITKLLNSEFKLKSVKKSKNTYKTTTIYFAKGKNTQADKIHRIIEKTVGKVIKEEADKLVGKYNSDIVIVVSK